MATKLKDLQITSVDFVEQGANPEAFLCLFKGAEQVEREKEGSEKKLQETLKESLSQMTEEAFEEMLQGQLKEKLQANLQENVQANLQESLRALGLKETEEERKRDSGDEGKVSAKEGQARKESEDGKESEEIKESKDGKKGEKNEEEQDETFFKSTDCLLLELERLDALGMGGSVVKGVVPELRKVFEELEAVKKSQAQELFLLKKGMEVERLEGFCKKFEALGKDPKALAEYLYRLKGLGLEFYQEFVQVLEESLGFLEQSGLFGERGVTGSGAASASVLTGHAKGVGGYSPQSLVQAWEKHPELASQYESDYRKGRFV